MIIQCVFCGTKNRINGSSQGRVPVCGHCHKRLPNAESADSYTKRNSSGFKWGSSFGIILLILLCLKAISFAIKQNDMSSTSFDAQPISVRVGIANSLVTSIEDPPESDGLIATPIEQSGQDVSIDGLMYKSPPTSRSSKYGVNISEAAMEACIRLYNETEWLADELAGAQVDSYDRVAVDAYYANLDMHNDMVNRFNANCAGTRSESAHKAVQRLNQEMQ